MKEYTKPVVEVTSEAAEGVYAASGGAKCDSEYMNYQMQSPTYGWAFGNVTVREAYGCLKCPAYTKEGGQCGMLTHFEDANQSGTYDVDSGNRMPIWEKLGYTEDTIVNDEVYNKIKSTS